MIPVSRRRLKAATRMVLLISSAAATSCTSAMTMRRRSGSAEDVEEAVEQLLLVLHVLDAGPVPERGSRRRRTARVVELDPEGLRQGVGADVRDQVGRVLELLLEALERLLLGLVEDRVAPAGIASQVGLQLGPLLSVTAPPAQVGGLAALAAQEDRDLDLVVPVVLHDVDLPADQQAGAEQRQAERHRHDDGDGHRQVAAQADADLAAGRTGRARCPRWGADGRAQAP